MPGQHQIAGKPGDHEIKKIVAGEVTKRGAPERTMRQDLCRIKRGVLGHWRGESILRHPLQPRWKPEQADEADPYEHWPPAISHHEEASAECANGIAGPQCGHERTTGETTMVFRQTAGQYLGACGQSDRFSDAKNKAHHEQEGKTAHEPGGGGR